MLQLECHKQRLDMTKTELQVALAAATETNKRTAEVFLDTLCILAYIIERQIDVKAVQIALNSGNQSEPISTFLTGARQRCRLYER